MKSIRRMTLNDLSQVAELDALAFNTARRTDRHLQACLDLNPGGCFIATDLDNQIIGYVFSRIWGCLGWIGVGGVRPDLQGKGCGTALVRRAIKQLRESGCEIVGCSTEAEKPDNVGTWARLGFLPGSPTLEFTKTIEWPKECLPFDTLNSLDKDMVFGAVRQLSQQVMPGLDYTSEVRNAYDYSWGETLLFGWPQPWAFAIVRTDSIREDSPHNLPIAVLVISRHARERFPDILSAIEGLACKENYSQIVLPVNASDRNALQQTLMCGFRVRNLLVRMTLDRPEETSGCVNLSRWIM